MKSEITLSICIPSYNRGKRALEGIQHILTFLDKYPDVEVVLSNNGSTKEIEEYEMVNSLNDERIIYTALEENQFYWGNINNVIKKSHGKYVLLVSDEDYVDESGLDYYLKLLKDSEKMDGVEAIRSATSRFYQNIPTVRLKKGCEGIEQFYVNNNYISGIIYNRGMLTDDVIDMLYEKYKSNIAYKVYTHMVFDFYLILMTDVLMDSTLLIVEGVACESTSGKADGMNLHNYAVLENRLAQMRAFVEIIKQEITVDGDELSWSIIYLISKYVFLVGLTANVYRENGVDDKYLVRALKGSCYECLIMLNRHIVNDNWQLWEDFINEAIDYAAAKW